MILEERLREVTGTKKSNCIGTALYLVGLVNTDECIDPSTIRSTPFASLLKIEQPVVGGLIAWLEQDSGYTDVIHLGVVANTSPLLIHNRHGCYGQFYLNQPFQEVNNSYGQSPLRLDPVIVEFYKIRS